MNRLVRRSVRSALPPHRLTPHLDEVAGSCAFDAIGSAGWGSRSGGQRGATSLLLAEPELEFCGGLEALARALAWLAPSPGADPARAVLAGSLAYDLGHELEPIPRRAKDDLGIPPVRLAGYRAQYRYDPVRLTGEVVGSDARAVASLHGLVCAAAERARRGTADVQLPTPGPSDTDQRFLDGVRRIKEWIRDGDVYQVNLSRRVELAPVADSDPAQLYDALCTHAGAPFCGFVDAGEFTVVSNSPERLLRVHGDRVETCPIKGTRPRGSHPEEDRLLAKDLEASAKDRAEHIMIVDLERNDLGRVCRTGSVRVASLAALRSYPTVHHLVSSVQGRLRDPLDVLGLLRATFPGGSITGAPKIRAMQIIESLEPTRRGVYTGSLGWFDAAGGLDLSIAIRTAVVRAGRLYLHLGGGIVADSDPQAELRETEDKGRAFARMWEGRP